MKRKTFLIVAVAFREVHWRVRVVCRPADAEISFEVILDTLTDNDPAVTDYIMREPAKCPTCKRAILENTFVELAA